MPRGGQIRHVRRGGDGDAGVAAAVRGAQLYPVDGQPVQGPAGDGPQIDEAAGQAPHSGRGSRPLPGSPWTRCRAGGTASLARARTGPPASGLRRRWSARCRCPGRRRWRPDPARARGSPCRGARPWSSTLSLSCAPAARISAWLTAQSSIWNRCRGGCWRFAPLFLGLEPSHRSTPSVCDQPNLSQPRAAAQDRLTPCRGARSQQPASRPCRDTPTVVAERQKPRHAGDGAGQGRKFFRH